MPVLRNIMPYADFYGVTRRRLSILVNCLPTTSDLAHFVCRFVPGTPPCGMTECKNKPFLEALVMCASVSILCYVYWFEMIFLRQSKQSCANQNLFSANYITLFRNEKEHNKKDKHQHFNLNFVTG